MSETIRIFVGTDARMGKAEAVLEHSIRKHSSAPIEITWMRAGDPGWDWNMGREPGHPYAGGGAWATDFTCFRFAVPEVAGFQGKAIYLDTDMFVRRDIAEIYNLELKKPWSTCSQRTDVSVINCGAFKDKPWWPSIAKMKPTAHKIHHYIQILLKHQFLVMGAIPNQWDILDGRGFNPKKTCLVHFTNMRTQPWKPWPETFKYPSRHPCPEVEHEFWELYREAEVAARERSHADPKPAGDAGTVQAVD